MVKSNILPNKRDDEETSMRCKVWFLRFIDRLAVRGESYQEAIIRLLSTKQLNNEDSIKLKQEIKNFEKFL